MATIFGPYSPLTSKNTCVKPDPGPIQLTINFTIQEESIMDIAFSLSPTTKKHRRIINLGEGLYGHYDH